MVPILISNFAPYEVDFPESALKKGHIFSSCEQSLSVIKKRYESLGCPVMGGACCSLLSDLLKFNYILIAHFYLPT